LIWGPLEETCCPRPRNVGDAKLEPCAASQRYPHRHLGDSFAAQLTLEKSTQAFLQQHMGTACGIHEQVSILVDLDLAREIREPRIGFERHIAAHDLLGAQLLLQLGEFAHRLVLIPIEVRCDAASLAQQGEWHQPKPAAEAPSRHLGVLRGPR
jgi:hypothetical protein